MALSDTVQNLIERVGVTYTFSAEPNADLYDPTTGSHHDIPADATATGSPPQMFDQYYIDGDIVKRDDLLIYVAGLGLSFTPTRGMVVSGSALSKPMLIERLQPFTTKDGVVAYAIHLRA